MFKRIVFTIIALGVVIGAGMVIGDSYRLMTHDNLAVSQLEDSNENVVQLNASTRMIRYMRLIQVVVVLILLWLIWNKYLKAKWKVMAVELYNEDNGKKNDL